MHDDVSLRMDLLFERGRAGAAAGGSYWERGLPICGRSSTSPRNAGDVFRRRHNGHGLSVSMVTASGDNARLLDQQLRCLAPSGGTREEATQRSLLLAGPWRDTSHIPRVRPPRAAASAARRCRWTGAGRSDRPPTGPRVTPGIVHRRAHPGALAVDHGKLAVGGIDGLEGGEVIAHAFTPHSRRKRATARCCAPRPRSVTSFVSRHSRRSRSTISIVAEKPRTQGDRGSRIGRGRRSARGCPLVA